MNRLSVTWQPQIPKEYPDIVDLNTARLYAIMIKANMPRIRGIGPVIVSNDVFEKLIYEIKQKNFLVKMDSLQHHHTLKIYGITIWTKIL